MGRGRPRRAAQRHHEEEILHGISTSTNKTTQAAKQRFDSTPNTPEGTNNISEVKSDKSKGETSREEQWPELMQYRGMGGNNSQSLKGMNGIVIEDKYVIKLNMPEKTPEKPWANLFAMNHMAARGSSLEKPLYADECTTQTSRISFARILVEMGRIRILPTVIKIQDPKGRVIEQQVRYEWKLIFCQKYLQVGHSCDKPGVPPPKKGQGQGPQKEWKPTIGKELVKDNDQQTIEKLTPDQEEWQTVRHRVAKKGVMQTDYTGHDDNTNTEDTM
ncbi:hypothetical protein H5410_001128 [Solanum commersonii]|uniref:DUF4283 domain-containing protein n=1 Tax=Solanum commersonii TaxID=4109 RepID=A0A9J6AYV0_SOLCO|nr:hypothetical protein H5410_001128 [Solanum commersonii]